LRWGPAPAAAVLALALAAGADPAATPSPFAGLRPVDLTHAFGEDTLYWPTEPPFRLEVLHAGPTEGGWWYAANRFTAPEHGGTHLDAPVHFSESGQDVAEIPLSRLVAPAVVVDAREVAAAGPDAAVGRPSFERFEAAHGRIPEGSIVLLRTGWGERWPDREAYLGTAARGPGAVAELHFPGLSAAAARWLVAERGVAAVGIDTASIDPGASTDFPAHRVLAAAQVPVLENVAALEELPPTGSYVVALPMKIRGGSGAPLRAVAWVPGEPSPGAD